MERHAVIGPAVRIFKLSLSFIQHFFTQNIGGRGIQPTLGQHRVAPTVPPRSTPPPWHSGPDFRARLLCRRASPPTPAGPHGAPPSHPHHPCRLCRLSAADTSVGPAAPACTCRLQPDQTKVLRAARERFTPPAVVAAVAKEEEVGHAIVMKANDVWSRLGPPPWRRRTRPGT